MKRGGRILLWVMFGLLMLAVLTFVTQQLWNWLIPDLFGGPVLTFWQALGLLVLPKILLGGFAKGGHREHSGDGMAGDVQNITRRVCQRRPPRTFWRWACWCCPKYYSAGLPKEATENIP